MDVDEESGAAALRCFTAPGVTFATRDDLHAHYKSEWHRYNLKRKVAGLPPIPEAMFDKLQLIAAERERGKTGDGSTKKTDHLKPGKRDDAVSKPAAAQDDGAMDESDPYEIDELELKKEVNVCESFMDGHVSPDLASNLEYLQKYFGFHIPDAAFVTDLPKLYKYCVQKVRAGKLCLSCERPFTSGRAATQHMIDKSHCKIPWANDEDMEEYEDFYDFSSLWEDDGGDDDTDAATTTTSATDAEPRARRAKGVTHEAELLVTGELLIRETATGQERILGHRQHRWMYKQRFQPEESRPAMLAASKERLLLAYQKAGVETTSALARTAYNGGRPAWMTKQHAREQRSQMRRQQHQQLRTGQAQNLLTKNRQHEKKQMGAGFGVHG